MKLIVIFACLIIFSETISAYPNNHHDHFSSDGTEPEVVAKNRPKIKSKGQTLAVDEGSSVTFPCEVEDLGSLSVTWGSKKGSSTAQITIGGYKFIQDDRIYLDGNNLVIKGVNQSDAGIYSCMIATNPPTSVSHTFFVNGRPHIVKEPTSGKLTLTKGQNLRLSCKTNHEPKPDIKWEKRDGKISVSATNQETLEIPNVGRQDAGNYRCSAFSFYGSDSHADFEVIVEEGPEIELPEPFVYTGIGQEVKLRCRVHGNPKPQVYIENSRNERLPGSQTEKDYVSVLKIRDERDFGKYTCSGANRFDKVSKEIEVSGRPSKPIILNSNDDFPTSGDQFELKYQVTSYSPITSILISYRSSKDLENFSEWITKSIEPTNDKGPSYQMNYMIENMDRSTYEVKVYAENEYGRSEGSEIYSITTDGDKAHWKAAGSSSYSIKSSSTILFICSLLTLATTMKHN